jgi:predicted regulator of Ras-like GTPase activity (Roadblock/LC7/MglB family)
MSFEAILQDIVTSCGGGIGAALMGSDGIPIAEFVAPQAEGVPLADDIGVAGVEFGRILEETRKASDALGGGAVVETLVVLARFSLLFRGVDDETFLVVALTPDGNLGKARYLMRRHLLAIRQEL